MVKRTIYAALYRMPDDRLKAHLIFIVNEKGWVEEYLPGPFTIGEYFGSRMKKEDASEVVCSFLKNIHPRMRLEPGDVKLYSAKKAGQVLFRLQNK
jgi:hypothetical protein